VLRQGTNWASRQGLTEVVRNFLRKHKTGPAAPNEGVSVSSKPVKLSVYEEALSGTIGGLLSTWNQPFEVMRIEAQVQATKGLPPSSFAGTFSLIVREQGWRGLFKGIVPRSGLCVAQTLFMVTVPHIMQSLDMI
jgi:hypothetical protein